MVNVVFWVYLLLFLLFPHIVETEPAENFVNLDSLQGDWLNKKYIETLQLTKSPCKAVEGIYYTAFTISKEVDSYKFLQLYNFHEGVKFNIIELLPSSEPNSYQIIYERIYVRQVIDPDTFINSFVIKTGKYAKEIEWIFIPEYGISEAIELHLPFLHAKPNIDEYVNRIVLAGNYTDEQGQTFVFSKSGEAKWPDKSFRYKVGLDSYWTRNQFDYFVVIGEKVENRYPKIIAFEWRNNKLLIFKTIVKMDGEIIVREKESLYVLTPR